METLTIVSAFILPAAALAFGFGMIAASSMIDLNIAFPKTISKVGLGVVAAVGLILLGMMV